MQTHALFTVGQSWKRKKNRKSFHFKESYQNLQDETLPITPARFHLQNR